ncbi:radial spoke head protein 9 homolog [Stomoxys calcitrans]|uniref:radial spoke head protein 9 homolog n=1 Tax=Stomoxys calcitrans TaxID=35570 RepID=UPI0027E29333|nr:radial spoke head protein 9 homolog [Stomoxys calcitrans]
MDINYFKESLDSLMHSGVTLLSPEEMILIENSLLALQAKNRFTYIYFWGRINGIERDYFIAFGCLRDCLKDRKFFYSLDGYQWLMLPFLQCERGFQATLLCRQPFCGDPSSINCVKLDPSFETGANHIISANLPEEIKLKEEDRLAAVVFIITEECAMCPRGALYKLTDGRVVPNQMFRGLNELQCEDLSFYQIYRLPRNDLRTNLSKRSDYNYTIDFLDSIEDVIAKDHAFSLNLLRNERFIVIKSLIWQGMTFFHKINSHKHGFLYIGDGKQNNDFPFMF